MRRWQGKWIMGALSALVVVVTSSASGQVGGLGSRPSVAIDEQAQREAEAQAAAERAALAEAILAREEAATGRAFDAAFRAATKQRLISRSLAELQALEKQEGQGVFGGGGQ